MYKPSEYATQDIARALSISVEYAEHSRVEGDIAEFGTMTGRSAVVLAKAVAQFSTTRRLLLFDSFRGLPAANNEVDRETHHVKAGYWGPGTCRGMSAPQLREVCKQHLPEAQLRLFDGWFADTIPLLPADTRLAVLHIDSDLYQSAVDVLDNVLTMGLVSPGAVVCFDDWDCNQANPTVGERRAWGEMVAKHDITFSDLGHYGWGSHRFLIHGYAQ